MVTRLTPNPKNSSNSHQHEVASIPVDIPVITSKLLKSVSQYRREELERETEAGLFREPGSKVFATGNGPSPAGFIRGSSMKKFGTTSSTTSGGYRGNGGTVQQNQDIYSPLWLDSNLNMPRDRATINSWSRAFFATKGFVHNAISLHSTYPISKLSIKCKNEKVEQFFAEMVEETDLMNTCCQIAQEFWTLGEAFPYAVLDDRSAKWSQIIIQNPDYITVSNSIVGGDPIISLRPDDNLKRIVSGNKPTDVQQRQGLAKNIIEHVKRNENIPLSNFYVSHLARKISPYDPRGTGLIVSSFRELALLDKLRECFDEETEILTDKGFKRIVEITKCSNSINVNPRFVNGIQQNDDGSLNIFTLDENTKVASYDNQTNEINFVTPEEFNVCKYVGPMHHYYGKKVDVCVTPNHKLLIREKCRKDGKPAWSDYKLVKSEEVISRNTELFKFKSTANWVGEHIDTINVLGKNIPAKLYFKFLGYFISEGCAYSNFENGRYDAAVSLSQATDSDCYHDMRLVCNSLTDYLNKKCANTILPSTDATKEKWEGRFHGKDIINYLTEEVGINNKCDSYNKKIPRWVLNLDKSLLKILLDALVKGDGSEKLSKYGTGSVGYQYCTVSKQLADDVSELVFKLGYSVNMCINVRKGREEYYVLWSTTNYGDEPLVSPGLVKDGIKGGGATSEIINYDGLVYCFEVPSGILITRRNGKISIQGNCKFAQAANMVNPLTVIKIGNENYKPTPQDLEAWRDVFESGQYDKDFKIFTHEGVTIEKIGSQGGIIDINPDVIQLIKEIYIGLMVPPVLMDGGGEITYANGTVSLDVLRQRYMQFRNMLTVWLRKKIFAPISKINDFYDYENGKKVLIVPDIDWNYMSLFDMADYTNILVQLNAPESKRVSLQTMYRSLGIDWEEEQRKIKMEAIDEVILEKEKAALQSMSLNDLRALGPNDEIQAPSESRLPGEKTPGEESGEPGVGEIPSPPDMGGMPPPPPPPAG